MRTKSAVGERGEQLATQYLVGRGFVVLDRNWRCDLGEIDIVARDGSALVVCEVKTRSGLGFGTPLEAVTGQKAARLRRLAGQWLEGHTLRPAEIRIDVIGVVLRPGWEPTIEHVCAAA